MGLEGRQTLPEAPDTGLMIDAFATASNLQGLRLDAGALDVGDLRAWSELADRAAEPNPFFRPEFVLANATERGLPVELVVARDDTRWLLCLPVRRRPPSRHFPFPRRTRSGGRRLYRHGKSGAPGRRLEAPNVPPRRTGGCRPSLREDLSESRAAAHRGTPGAGRFEPIRLNHGLSAGCCPDGPAIRTREHVPDSV